MSHTMIPFGKYRGQPIDVLANDQSYVEWLAQQSWVRERYPDVYTLIVNNFGEPEETPEHNALQARLLDDHFCRQLLAVIGEKYLEGSIFLKQFEEDGVDVNFQYRRWEIDARSEAAWTNNDVDWYLSSYQVAIECKSSLGDDYPAVLRQMHMAAKRFRSWHDTHWILLIEKYSGSAVSLEQVTTIFRLSNIRLISLYKIAQAPVQFYTKKPDIQASRDLI